MRISDWSSDVCSSDLARYASFLTRHAQDDKAIGIYREVVTALANSQRSTAGMANVMAPYYRLLANRAATDPAAVGEFFVASQLPIRPGVAATPQVLAGELSCGSDDGGPLVSWRRRCVG